MEPFATNQRSRFVVLHHEMPPTSDRASHWDFMLEFNGQLETWSLAECPVAGRKIAAMRLPPHRIDYLFLEGPVSGDRGSVSRIMSGTFAGDVADLASRKSAVFQLYLPSPWMASFEMTEDGNWSVSFELMICD